MSEKTTEGPKPVPAEAPLLPYVCTIHGNTVKDVAPFCDDFKQKPLGLFGIRSCINCINHVTPPAEEKKGVFITPKQRQDYLARAADWWDRTARHMVSQEKNSERTKRRFREATALAPAILTTGAKEVVIPSGILNGRMFNNLAKHEQARVLKIWMHHFTPFQFPDLTERERELALEQSVKQIITEH